MDNFGTCSKLKLRSKRVTHHVLAVRILQRKPCAFQQSRDPHFSGGTWRCSKLICKIDKVHSGWDTMSNSCDDRWPFCRTGRPTCPWPPCRSTRLPGGRALRRRSPANQQVRAAQQHLVRSVAYCWCHGDFVGATSGHVSPQTRCTQHHKQKADSPLQICQSQRDKNYYVQIYY